MPPAHLAINHFNIQRYSIAISRGKMGIVSFHSCNPSNNKIIKVVLTCSEEEAAAG